MISVWKSQKLILNGKDLIRREENSRKIIKLMKTKKKCARLKVALMIIVKICTSFTITIVLLLRM